MITYRQRDRTGIAAGNVRLAARLEAGDAQGEMAQRTASSDYTARLVARAQERRAVGGRA